MSDDKINRRYAVYFTPDHGSSLGRMGRNWLGYDAITQSHTPLKQISGVSADKLSEAVTPASRYGFHATLKAPFYLPDSGLENDLKKALQRLADNQSSFNLPRLKLRRIGSRLKHFFALVPSRPSHAMNGLAEKCVRRLDAYRKPPTLIEVNRRRAAGLSPLEDQYLVAWGYPYVLDRFRFHLSLTGQVRDQEISRRILNALEALLTEVDLDGEEVNAVCLFVQENEKEPFYLDTRFSFYE